MSLRYSSITEEHGGCPVVIAVGPSETGKTTALTAALSLTGLHIVSYGIKFGIMVVVHVYSIATHKICFSYLRLCWQTVVLPINNVCWMFA